MTTLYRTPNLVLGPHEWHAVVKIKDGRIRRMFYFRPNASSGEPKDMWLPLTQWKGHKPKSREFRVFAPYKRHMLLAERSVVENARRARSAGQQAQEAA